MINVSDLNKYTFCPRSLYLTYVLKITSPPTDAQVYGLLGHAVRKEFSLRQAKIIREVDSGQTFSQILSKELEKILRDAPFIYKDMLPKGFEKHIPSLKKSMKSELSMMEKHFNTMIQDMGLEKTLDYLTPWRVEYSVRSDELDLTGRIDKIYKRESLAPVELKTGKPADKVWPGDRIQIGAYLMLLEQNTGEEIPHGYVEYTRIMEQLPVLNTEKLRREVIYTRDEVEKILEGHDPGVCPHGSHKKCVSCSLEPQCYTT